MTISVAAITARRASIAWRVRLRRRRRHKPNVSRADAPGSGDERVSTAYQHEPTAKPRVAAWPTSAAIAQRPVRHHHSARTRFTTLRRALLYAALRISPAAAALRRVHTLPLNNTQATSPRM